MLFEWQGILQFISHVFFLSRFTRENNAEQSYRLSHCIKNLHRYNLKPLKFKHPLLFIHIFKNTTQALKTFFLLANRSQMLYLFL